MDEPKALWRQRLREARRRLTPELVASLSSAIVRHVVAAPFYRRARTIGLYQPIDNEVDPALLLLDAASLGKLIFLPVVEKESRCLRFVSHTPGASLRVGAFGIPEPDAGAGRAVVEPGGLDLIVQPLVGFDKSGCRLGFGGGYYDRALAGVVAAGRGAPELVGLAYGFQEVDSLVGEPHDVPMGWVVTEEGARFFSHRAID